MQVDPLALACASLVLLKGEALRIAYGIHILGSLWLWWADFWQP